MDIKLILSGGLSIVLAILKAIDEFLKARQDIIAWIVLRVQKDSADGTWTDEEKEQGAIDLYNEKIKGKLPFYISIFITEGMIRRLIKSLCSKSKELKVQ